MTILDEEFAAALAKGSGRAMKLLLQAPERKGLHDQIIRACVSNLAFDRQCESERSAYLARLITASDSPAALFSKLETALISADEDTDVPQLFTVLVRLVRILPQLEGDALRGAFAGLSDEDQLDCMEGLILLDGAAALLDCAELLASRLKSEGWRVQGMLDALFERDGANSEQTLRELRANHLQLDELMSSIEDVGQPEPSVDDEAYDLAAIRSDIFGGRRPPGAWRRKLSQADWSSLTAEMLERIDENDAAQLLRHFTGRPFPDDPTRLFKWLDSPIPRVSGITAGILGRVPHPRVRQEALQRLAMGDQGVRLLLANYQPGDFAKIEPLLHKPPSEERAHDLGLSVLALLDKNDVSTDECRTTLLNLYEHTPCSLCRNSAVRTLVRRGAAPAWMADECRFDADPETVRLFSTS
ncbi:hypothetical protein [Phenylobacterium aquaticum]|uniref:hypothetical protein n=1 Tax=Phenylobacterium aquaticum TaxID=1763816 RepID=UPI001F5E0A52|nr:hypothetical protein [Phenylobacterium aquaticum]MCI3134305.1 hypothetical protein [Phenylobacterium aquaticum]